VPAGDETTTLAFMIIALNIVGIKQVFSKFRIKDRTKRDVIEFSCSPIRP
jgi:hypothetical protein